MKKRVILVLFVIAILTFSFLQESFNSVSYAGDSKKLVLLELFTAEWCGPCGKANPVIDKVYEESGGKDFLLIKFHVSDDMECKLSEERAQKYGVEGIPTLVVDGKDSIVGAVENYESTLKGLIQNAKGKKTNVSIEVSGQITGNKAKATVSFAGAPSGAKLIAVLVEDFYYYRARNGEIFHRFLARDGSTISVKDSGSETFNFEINSNWAKEMLRCIVFIEDSSGVIQNSAYATFGTPEPDLSKAVLSVVPNEIEFGQVKEGEMIRKELIATNAGKVDATLKLESKEVYVKFSNTSFSVSPKTQAKISFTIDTTGLTPKLYKSVIKVSSQNYSKEIPLNLEVLPKPSLFVDKQTLNFGKVRRGEKPRLSFLVRNNNRGPIKGTISSKDKWLIISKKSFNDQEVEVNVTALTKDLPQGKSEGEINIESDGGDAVVKAEIEIAAPKLEFEPSELNFGEIEINGSNLEGSFLVINKGDIATDVEVVSIPEFVKIVDKKFSLNVGEEKKVNIELIKDKLKLSSKNEGKIIFSYSDEEAELKVSVYPVERPPILSLTSENISGNKISISLKKGEKYKVEIEIRNSGGSILEGKIEIEPKVNWASLSIADFSLKHDEGKKLVLNLSTADLKPGKYETNLKFSSNAGEKNIPLTLEVIREKIVIELKIGSNKATVSGRELTVEPPPYIKNGTTLVPLRFISEAFGAEVEWQPNIGKGMVVIKFESKVIQVEIGSQTAFINGIPNKLPVPPEIKNGRTFVPIRFISEAFGAEVQWVASEQKIIIVL